MIKYLKNLYKKYDEWCVEPVSFDFEFDGKLISLETNNYTAYMLPLAIFAFILLCRIGYLYFCN